MCVCVCVCVCVIADFVEISMAICTDLDRLSLMCWSTGSMLWTSTLVITCTSEREGEGLSESNITEREREIGERELGI